MRRKQSDRVATNAKSVKPAADNIALRPWQIEEVGRALMEAEAGDFAFDKEVQAMFKKFR